MDTITITVTTAPGKPTLDLPASASNRQIAEIVQQRYGMHVASDSSGHAWSMPHSYCGKLDPAPALCHRPGPFLVNPGHLRAC
ncbi:MAG: hypothetical protein IPP57_09100 [Candidatus Obscuribacter sp.]|jgi:hypothetical protein|nr:hypothetical protein [Candidatus Obscuribacter sp.]MBK7840200.1 hypothetical protein [Candidatus Obscuribacter sp.]MBK9204338.1 hypothetical protein [Candidatus Obscuribacter sp.]MBK9770965.1 hypothetical protein [Candidatus Obscuribacter sp.]MBL0186503.1 hypothetical protein [Candidatus Obscuribacter sp.]